MLGAANKLNLFLCDDNSHFLGTLKRTLKDLFNELEIRCDIFSFINPLEMIKTDLKDVDIFFIDIEMPEMDGLAVSSIVNRAHPEAKIIFMTNHEQYLQAAFRVRPFRYLFKNCTSQEIKETITDAIAEISDIRGIMIYDFKTDSDYFIKFISTYRIESIGDFSIVFIKESSYMVRKSLKLWEKDLDDRFLLCHKSHIVNMQWIRSIKRDSVIMHNYQSIPMSPRNYKTVKATYHKYLYTHSKLL